MAIFSTLLAGAATGALDASGFNTQQSISSLFGGSACTPQKQQQGQQIASDIRTYLTEEEKQDLVSGMESYVQPTAMSMAQFFIGGRDCKHKNVTPGDQRFLRRLPDVIRQAKQRGSSRDQAGPSLSAVSAGLPNFLQGNTLVYIGLAIGAFFFARSQNWIK